MFGEHVLVVDRGGDSNTAGEKMRGHELSVPLTFEHLEQFCVRKRLSHCTFLFLLISTGGKSLRPLAATPTAKPATHLFSGGTLYAGGYGSRAGQMTRPDHLARRRAAWLSVIVTVGCTSMLDIDGKYVASSSTGGHTSNSPDASPRATDSGKIASGGTGGSSTQASGGSESGGWTTASGGVAGSGGTLASGGAAGSSAGAPPEDCSTAGCPEGQKCCGTATEHSCYVPSPLVGCDPMVCSRCPDPVPTNSTPSCSKGKCSFTCDPGFMQESGTCVAISSGGAGGASTGGRTGSGGSSTSSSGSGGSTDVSCVHETDCHKTCGVEGPAACCRPNNICGCTYFQIDVGPGKLGYCVPYPPGF
jgi:hypothetical protein